MKYRKKPVVIEAFRWKGELRFPDWAEKVVNVSNDLLVVPTLEGDMTASPGDWIIKGVEGEIYPCKDSIFRATYEAVEEQ